MATTEHKLRPGPKPRHSQADKHEMRRYREAGVSVRRLAGMYGVTESTIHAYLRELRVRLGPEKLPPEKKHLARLHLFSSGNLPSSGPQR